MYDLYYKGVSTPTDTASHSALTLVRRNLDELMPNGSAMYGSQDRDNESLDDLVARLLPDAVNAVHLAAPVHLLEGESIRLDEEAGTPGYGWIDFEMKGSLYTGVAFIWLPAGYKYLRLVAFRAADSEIILTNAIPAASPEGRMQLDKYLRGRSDRPCLVRRQGSLGEFGSIAPEEVGTNEFTYYTFSNPAYYAAHKSAAVPIFEVVPKQEYKGKETTTKYPVSSRLVRNVIDHLTALVLEAYSDQRARVFFTRAADFENV